MKGPRTEAPLVITHASETTRDTRCIPNRFLKMSHPIRTVISMDISIPRIHAMMTAIELGVDDSDFRFESLAEREMFVQLEAEHNARVDKDDCCWLAA